MTSDRGHITPQQYAALMSPIRPHRIAKRSQGGKDLSYLEAWDVRAHLLRTFGFGNFDAEVTEAQPVFERAVKIGSGDREKDGIECAWQVTLRLVLRDGRGREICRFSESSVGSATGSVNYGDLHDNAIKQAASDALKRCAINLGSQFGLSLYDNGSTREVVKTTLVTPKGMEAATPQEATDAPLSDEAAQALKDSLGATEVAPAPQQAAEDSPPADGPQFDRQIDTPEATEKALDDIRNRKAAKP
jgi:recombination DNA repair RAD52 pathway protein